VSNDGNYQPGTLSALRLNGNQGVSQQTILAYQPVSEPIPYVGKMLLLSVEDGVGIVSASQYVQVTGIAQSVYTFTDGDGDYDMRTLMLAITPALLSTYAANAVSRAPTDTSATKIRLAQVVSPDSYYGLSIKPAWPASQGQDAPRQARTPTAVQLDPEIAASWQRPVSLDTSKRGPWGIATQQDSQNRSTWGQYATLHRASTSLWGIATATDRSAVSPWGQYLHYLTASAAVPWGISTATDKPAASPWGQYARRLSGISAIVWGISRRTDYACPSPWGQYQTRLALAWTAPTETGEGALVIPIQRTYIVINDISLERVSDSLNLPATSISLSIDADTWTWGFNASLPASALDDVIGTPGAPVELAANINGTEFRLLVERITRSRSFGRNTINLSGRGIAALLDAPYAAPASLYSAAAITAQQAAENAITLAGLPAGWALNWQLTDWLLPAGLWSHQGTPMSAVNRIAAAAGGYVQADPLAQTLHILPRYPLAPWAWSGATIDYEIPSAIAVTEGIEWTDNPDYDVVYVSGEAGGVLGRILRTGEAGTRPAQMVTDNLITHADAARQRGLSILGTAGRTANISLSMPILTASGIIKPGAMIEYTDGSTTRIGIARGVSITAGQPTVRQTVEIECHE
jgi:hypothetical protein